MSALPHRKIAEKALGRPLDPNHPVHHAGGGSLVICESGAYHRLLHKRMNRLELGLDLDGPISKTFRFRASPTMFPRLREIAIRNHRTASDQARVVLEEFIDREEKKQAKLDEMPEAQKLKHCAGCHEPRFVYVEPDRTF